SIGGPAATAASAETAPGSPEDQRDDEANSTDNHQDHTDSVDIPVRRVNRGSEPKYGSDREHDNTRGKTHLSHPMRVRRQLAPFVYPGRESLKRNPAVQGGDRSPGTCSSMAWTSSAG